MSAEPRPALGDRERRILDEYDRLACYSAGPRERFIREQLGLSPTHYFQLVNAMLDSVEALAYKPVTVNRLRRLREERAQRRSSQPEPTRNDQGPTFSRLPEGEA
ncbi:DUF3263 domain-containing protein [Streptomyces sp. NPDC088752]|uniref:DUF3263 domain-containing protein n=1 Tax=Streptomyces sp. NPDC088752 TaxID=3154963 RepID=UPI0034181423